MWRESCRHLLERPLLHGAAFLPSAPLIAGDLCSTGTELWPNDVVVTLRVVVGRQRKFRSPKESERLVSTSRLTLSFGQKPRTIVILSRHDCKGHIRELAERAVVAKT